MSVIVCVACRSNDIEGMESRRTLPGAEITFIYLRRSALILPSSPPSVRAFVPQGTKKNGAPGHLCLGALLKDGGDLLSRLRSTIGAAVLNCSVRNGKRWNHSAIATKSVRVTH